MLTNLVSIAAVVGLLIVAAAAIGANFRSSRAATALANYRTLAESWEQRARLLEAQDTEKAQQIAVLTARVGVLQDMVTGKTQLETLTRQVGSLTADLAARWSAQEARVGEILNQVGVVRGDVRAVRKALAGKGTSDDG